MTKTLKIILSLWGLAALALGLSGVTQRYPIIFVQSIGASTLLAQVLAFSFSKSFRGIAMNWSLRTLTLFHVWRIIPGALFLYNYHLLGRLPFDFAVIGGWGDILVGITAIPMCPLGNADRPKLLKILLGWQVLALGDLVFVLRAAVAAGLANPPIMAPITEMPLVLLPLSLVPITLFAHFVAIAQLIRRLRG
jgi:hypothetical protein